MSQEFDFEHLVRLCRRAHQEMQGRASRAVDRSLVERNWLFGRYVVEFENGGADRTELYGKALIARLSAKLKAGGVKGCSQTNLRKFRHFYLAYPEIQQTVSVESPEHTEIRQTPPVESLLTPADDGAILTNIVNYGPNDEVIRLLYDAFGPSKLIWGSEFAAYNLVGPPFTPERYAQSLNYMRRRCDYMTQDDLRLIHGGNLQRVFDIPD